LEIQKLVETKWKNRFDFVRQLDSGGQGDVALIYDRALDMHFVCKSESLFDDEARLRFYEELKAMYSSYHINVVRIFSHHVLSGNPTTGFILMEYIVGRDIFSYLKDKPEELPHVFEQSIEGFKHLESNRIIHRDLRNNNILVTDQGLVKIIDFGYGKMNVDKNETNTKHLNWPASEPEEVANAHKSVYDSRTDIYYLGCIFKNAIEKLHLNGYTDYLDTIIDKMCESKLDHRYQNFEEILQDIYSNLKSSVSANDKSIFRKLLTELSDTLVGFYDKPGAYDFEPKSVVRKLKALLSNSEYQEEITNFLDFSRSFFADGDLKINRKKEFTGEYENGDYNWPINRVVPIDKKAIEDFIDLLKRNRVEAIKVLKNLYFNFVKQLPLYSRTNNESDLPF